MQADISIQNYLQTLRTQRQLSPHTLKNYQLDLDELLSFANGKPLAELSYTDLRRLTTQKHAAGLNPRSIARKLS
ncbi:MAG: site-specific integrase, partial [Burkholderiaceae bacterium]|nr:site-specific integrase [Burkholderiaceae bacterium]